VARQKVKALRDDIYQASHLDRSKERLRRAMEQLADCAPALSKFREETCEETLSLYHFPLHHRRRRRTTNSLERLNEEVCRRTHVIRIFSNRDSCLRMVASLCMEKSEEWETGHRYLTIEKLG